MTGPEPTTATAADRPAPLPEVEPARRPGSRRLPAIVAIVAIVAVSAAITWLLVADAGDATVLPWAPAESALYVEARLDLPGDQGDELAALLSALPGFDDRAAFPAKLSEALDRLVADATDGGSDYATAIDPWFDGSLALAARPGAAATPDAVLLAGTTDPEAAAAWAERIVGAGSRAPLDVAGTAVHVVEGDAAEGAVAWAVYGPVLGIGSPAALEASIRTAGTAGLGSVAAFRDAAAAMPGDRLALAWADTAALRAAGGAGLGLGLAPVDLLGAGLDPVLLATSADAPWAVLSIRAEGDALVVRTAAPAPGGGLPAGAPALPRLLPASTIALVEVHDGRALVDRVAAAAALAPDLEGTLSGLADALAVLGGPEALSGWIGELGIAVVGDAAATTAGVVVVPADPYGAERLFTQLRGLAALAGAAGGGALREEEYAGATMVAVDLSALAALVPTGSDGAPTLPGDLGIAWVVGDGFVAIGGDAAFPRAVLDAPGSATLAAEPRFAAAVERAGGRVGSLAWIDLRAIRAADDGLLERILGGLRGLVPGMPALDLPAILPDDAVADATGAALDAVIAVTSPGEGLDRATLIIRVSED